MPERFSAFSFVDRITALEPGRWARGRFAVPAELPEFSTCLVAEAVGQLAAWVAMAQAEFRRRPVAALSEEMRIEREAAPGEILDLEVEIESGDSDTVAFAGWARLADGPVLSLSRCVGPMLPLEDFDDPEAVRGDFETLCGPGARPGRFGGIAKLDLVLIDRVPGQRLRATMNVPVSAPFFADHFPRRPVFPASLLLDAQVRRATGGAKSLDDVMRLAYRRYGGDRGFTPEQFRATASGVAGRDLSGWFRQVVSSADELDYTAALDWFGLQFVDGSWTLAVRQDATTAQRDHLRALTPPS